MSNYNSSRKMMPDKGGSMMVLDTFINMARIVDSDVIASSVEPTIVAGQEGPASQLGMTGNKYTTVTLKPSTKDVNFPTENYIHHQFKVDVSAEADVAPKIDMPFAIHFPETAAIPSRIQLLINNSIIYQNEYNRVEATATAASMPQDVVNNSPDYFTIDKILRHEHIPGFYVTWKANQTKQHWTGHMDCNIDLQALSPIISNIPFVTTDMNLRIRLFYDNLDEAMLITPIPVAGYDGSNIIAPNFKCVETMPLQKPFKLKTATLFKQQAQAQDGAVSKFTFKLENWATENSGVEIVQFNASIKEESKLALRRFIEQDNQLIIPTQTFSVAQSTAVPNGTSNGELMFQLSAYNVAMLAFLFPYDSRWSTYYPQTRMGNVDISLNSKSICYVPYTYNNDARAFKDMAQAMLNDDVESVNDNVAESYHSIPFNGNHFDEAAYKQLYADVGSTALVKHPNQFIMAKSLEPPDTFFKGECMAASNPTATQIRFKYTLLPNIDEGVDRTNPGPLSKTNANAYCLALQDCCIKLNWSPQAGNFQSADLVYTTPVHA